MSPPSSYFPRNLRGTYIASLVASPASSLHKLDLKWVRSIGLKASEAIEHKSRNDG